MLNKILGQGKELVNFNFLMIIINYLYMLTCGIRIV